MAAAIAIPADRSAVLRLAGKPEPAHRRFRFAVSTLVDMHQVAAACRGSGGTMHHRNAFRATRERIITAEVKKLELRLQQRDAAQQRRDSAQRVAGRPAAFDRGQSRQ